MLAFAGWSGDELVLFSTSLTVLPHNPKSRGLLPNRRKRTAFLLTVDSMSTTLMRLVHAAGFSQYRPDSRQSASSANLWGKGALGSSGPEARPVKCDDRSKVVRRPIVRAGEWAATVVARAPAGELSGGYALPRPVARCEDDKSPDRRRLCGGHAAPRMAKLRAWAESVRRGHLGESTIDIVKSLTGSPTDRSQSYLSGSASRGESGVDPATGACVCRRGPCSINATSHTETMIVPSTNDEATQGISRK